MFQNAHFDNFGMNTVNSDINIEQNNKMLPILLENNIDNFMFQNKQFDNFVLNTMNSVINIEQYNGILEIPLYNIL